MIEVKGGWAQWDWSIKTYRAQIGDDVYGNFTDEIPDLESLEALLSGKGVFLSEQDRADLTAEKALENE